MGDESAGSARELRGITEVAIAAPAKNHNTQIKMFRLFLILSLLPSLSPAQLVRCNSRLVLLGPDIQVQPPPQHAWEGPHGTLHVTQDGEYLTLHLHADVGDSPLWIDCQLCQQPGGAIFCYWSCEQAHDFHFLRFSSFAGAWRDRRVRETWGPYFAAMGWKVPRVQMGEAG